MAPDKWIAVFFLLLSMLYGLTAFDYSLLPFERNLVFLPNTLPKALSVFGVLLSLLILFAPFVSKNNSDTTNTDTSPADFRQYKIGQAVGLIAAMLVYALTLRTLGFIAATTLFLAGSGFILGERKLHIMLPVAFGSAIFIWYLVQELLGIFLRPLPWFMS